MTLAVDAMTTYQSYSYVAKALADRGWQPTWNDLPAHGADVRPDEVGLQPLERWAKRVAAGEDIVTPFTRYVSDWITGQRLDRVVLVGVSRGGFMALHAAARDKRIDGVVAFCPVTDLRLLTEFAGHQVGGLASQLGLGYCADQLRGRPVWIQTPSIDARVNALMTIEFAEVIGAQLVVTPGAPHGLPDEAIQNHAIEWVSRLP